MAYIFGSAATLRHHTEATMIKSNAVTYIEQEANQSKNTCVNTLYMLVIGAALDTLGR